MSDDTPAEEAPVTFNIKSSSDAKYVLTLPLSTTVIDLKQKLSSSEYADLPPDRQRLIYSGRVLKDPDTLGSYKIKEGHTVHLVKGAASNQRQNPANQGTTSSTGTSGSSPAVTGVPQNIAAGTGNNPLAGLTGARYAGFAQLPGAGMFGPDGGMGPPPDPEQVINMLQNPQFASTLNEALQNPQLIDMMIQQNPMLRNMGPEVRQMMQSDQFRRMMTDPEALRSMGQMQRMFGGGGMGGMGGGGGGEAFPAPGVTDNTPGEQPDGTNRAPSPGQGSAPPMNPFAMFGNPAAMGGAAGGVGGGAQGQGQGQVANPFAQLFNPAVFGGNPQAAPFGNPTPTTSPPPAGAPSTPSQNAQQPNSQQGQPPNPFANLASNPLLQNPALMQQMMQTMMGGGAGTGGGAAGGGNPMDPAANPFAALMGGMGGAGMGQGFGQQGGGGVGGMPAAPQDTRPPEERYAEQLRQLNDMGFYEFERNVEALRRTGGSVQGAVEYLLTH